MCVKIKLHKQLFERARPLLSSVRLVLEGDCMEVIESIKILVQTKD